VLTSSGTDTYSAIAAGIGSLKGPRHGGANIKVSEMIRLMSESVDDITDEGKVADYLIKLINKEAGDRSGLIYGMGHAVYTLSDPRQKILKQAAEKYAAKTEFAEEFEALCLIERLTPEIFAKQKGNKKKMCANVDMYSGIIYKMLRIPEDLYTPLFAIARMPGWAAHRMEELTTGARVIRPAYKSVSLPVKYIPISQREGEYGSSTDITYIPVDERM
jgi:citrate synthase